ncbi:ABC transporter ATP-binding protein [Gulosibacter sp. ACHW.36C]|uniref:ATP-binding cassette domain-containing protein n=1 Tax=Gulosibacter sediminis TaxID=1729695 RepID=A0ABY4MYU5_9MICO|nr:ATP-binding cassette domain-containing protein [Gulosibacter sediminis]UQN14173.1 ATP-binding cassette domain-containing protein [Gulosibacter sediminis]
MADPIIVIENLSFRYPGAEADVLRNVNLTIERGDFVAVVGGNGASKTTLCKSINGLIPHYWSGDFAGSVTVDGVDTYTSSVAELSTRVGYVYQDFQNQLVRPTVRDDVAFGPINFGRDSYKADTDAALDSLGIAHLEDRYIWQLSGGQAHLTALAGALALRPEVIIVDEPVAELDPARAEEIYERLAELNREHGVTVITIEHHAEFVAKYAKSVVLMAHGSPVWHLPIEDALRRTDELEQHGIPAPQAVQAVRALGLDAAPRTPAEAAELLGAHPVRADVVVEDRAEAADLLGAHPLRTDVTGDYAPVVAQVENVTHGYKSVGGNITPVLQGLDTTLRSGERIALVGGNGAGKSTLLKLLAGIIVAREGEVVVDGKSTRSVSARKMADTAAYLYQHPQLMFLKGTVRDDVALFPRSRKVADTDQIVQRVLERVALTPIAERDGRTLSGGQQRRATLAIGLAMRPKLLLLDEPTSSLDTQSRDDVTTMLAELADTIECTVVATHDMQLVAEWANRVLVLEGGRILADVTPRELFTDAALLDQVRLRPPQIAVLGRELGLDPVPLSVGELVAAVAAPLNHLEETH